jgi:hypothetical protein
LIFDDKISDLALYLLSLESTGNPDDRLLCHNLHHSRKNDEDYDKEKLIVSKASLLRQEIGCSFISWLIRREIHFNVFKLGVLAYSLSRCLLTKHSLCGRAGVVELTCSCRFSLRLGRLLVSNRCALTITRVRTPDNPPFVLAVEIAFDGWAKCAGPSTNAEAETKEADTMTNEARRGITLLFVVTNARAMIAHTAMYLHEKRIVFS